MNMEFPQDKSPIVFIGDVIEKLKELKEENVRVDTIITSPPYWGQRDYGVNDQIGTEMTQEKYIENLLKVADL